MRDNNDSPMKRTTGLAEALASYKPGSNFG